MDYKEILTASMVIFAVIDIVGSIPLVISLREKAGHIQSEKASIVSAVIMIAFLFLGEKSSDSLVLMSIILLWRDPL
jgi:multiple antibiotic resistance protein